MIKSNKNKRVLLLSRTAACATTHEACSRREQMCQDYRIEQNFLVVLFALHFLAGRRILHEAALIDDPAAEACETIAPCAKDAHGAFDVVNVFLLANIVAEIREDTATATEGKRQKTVEPSLVGANVFRGLFEGNARAAPDVETKSGALVAATSALHGQLIFGHGCNVLRAKSIKSKICSSSKYFREWIAAAT